MAETLIIEYRGFQAKPQVREYTFLVREAPNEPRKYTLTILLEDFDAHRARYQDAPDICSLRLRRELAANANRPEKAHFRITDADLDEYRHAHAPKSIRSLYPPRPSREA
jgi:hypothetical protein